MMDLFKRDKETHEIVYFSKSRAFLLPLTGITQIPDFEIRSYVKWDNYSIYNYELVVRVEYGYRFETFQEYLKTNLLSDGRSIAREVYDFEGFSIIVFDLSAWSKDVEEFLKGRYSKFSRDAKAAIISYHTVYKNKKPEIGLITNSCIYPDVPQEALDNMTPLEYAIKHYVSTPYRARIDTQTERMWRDIGELCSICDEEKETLVLDESQCVISIDVD